MRRPPNRAPRTLESLGRTSSAISDCESRTGRGMAISSPWVINLRSLLGRPLPVELCAAGRTERNTPASSECADWNAAGRLKKSTLSVLRHIPACRDSWDDGQSRTQTKEAAANPDRGQPKNGQHRNPAPSADANTSPHIPGCSTHAALRQKVGFLHDQAQSNDHPTRLLTASAK